MHLCHGYGGFQATFKKDERLKRDSEFWEMHTIGLGTFRKEGRERKS